MFRRVLARCIRNGPPVLWPLTILSRKSESMIPLISLWNNRRPSGIHAQRKCSKCVRICFRWRGLKNVFSAGNVRRRQSHLIWFTSRTTFQSVCHSLYYFRQEERQVHFHCGVCRTVACGGYCQKIHVGFKSQAARFARKNWMKC